MFGCAGTGGGCVIPEAGRVERWIGPRTCGAGKPGCAAPGCCTPGGGCFIPPGNAGCTPAGCCPGTGWLITDSLNPIVASCPSLLIVTLVPPGLSAHSILAMA